MGAPSFKGSVTYASVPLEIVDRSRFDFVSVDLHPDVRIRDRFTDLLRGFFGYGRLVVITEFGCRSYRGAADAGEMGWATSSSTSPSTARGLELNGEYVRDEAEQGGS